MSKEWKAPDKVTQKMTRDGAVAENLTTGETMILSILVDTFISKISFPMQPGPEIGSISDA